MRGARLDCSSGCIAEVKDLSIALFRRSLPSQSRTCSAERGAYGVFERQQLSTRSTRRSK